MDDRNGQEFEGYINQISVCGKIYKLRCEVVEVYAMNCPRCGGELKLEYGSGKCQYCDTTFTTQFKLVEEEI